MTEAAGSPTRGTSRRAVRVLAGAALLLLGFMPAALACARARAASVPMCSAHQVEVWLGDGEGGGTLGSIYYPLEFSNISHSSCTLDGFPGVSAYGENGKLLGVPAQRQNGSSASPVTLAPGASAHALLQIVVWGAVCSQGVKALGLRVYAPGSKQYQPIGFPFEVCAHAGVLNVAAVHSGIGVPGYTTS